MQCILTTLTVVGLPAQHRHLELGKLSAVYSILSRCFMTCAKGLADSRALPPLLGIVGTHLLRHILHAFYLCDCALLHETGFDVSGCFFVMRLRLRFHNRLLTQYVGTWSVRHVQKDISVLTELVS